MRSRTNVRTRILQSRIMIGPVLSSELSSGNLRDILRSPQKRVKLNCYKVGGFIPAATNGF